MNLIDFVLFLCTSAVLISTPIYFFYRGRMSKSRIKPSNYSKKRVLKVTLINIFLMVINYILFLGLYLIVLTQAKEFKLEYIFLSILLFIVNGIVFYGGGVYVTSIVLEAYTPPELTKHEFFKTQLIAIKMFHHPISHVLLVSGLMFAMLILTFLNISIGQPSLANVKLLFLMGTLSGLVYAYSQIRNGTAIFNIPAGIICLGLLLSYLKFYSISFSETSLGSYYFSLLIMYNITMATYLLTLKKRNRKIFKPVTDIHPLTYESHP